VIVAQLWLRSVTHTARLLGVWRDIGIVEDRIFSVINRSGAKFKEAVSAKDYENVCRKKIDYYISNDIKAIVAAENEGKTIPEIGNSPLTKQFRDLAGVLAGVATIPTAEVTNTAPKAGLSIVSVFNRK
jgi:Flp pilus assembly CpaE family ATPase